MKRTKLPKVDLSIYNTEERLPENIEQIVLNALIYFAGDTAKVSRHLNLNAEIVNKIYVKWYLQLIKIISMKDKSEETDEAINIGLDLMKKHLAEIKKNRDASQTNIMTATLTKNINSIMDRLLCIKENATKAYDNVTNKLIDGIVRVKTLEKLELGQIEDNSDYVENVNTVADRMKEYVSSLGENKNQSKTCVVENLENGDKMVFESMSEAARFLKTTSSHLSHVILSKAIYKKIFKCYYLEDKEAIN